MPSPATNFRRATLEDLGALTDLWRSMQFPVEELGKRITEFQVATSPEGKLLGAVGIQIAQRQGKVHSEAFVDFAQADQLRPWLWERVSAVATNHGLWRLWTLEQAPFWRQCGLAKPDEEALKKLPPVFGTPGNSGWLTLKLKADVESLLSVDQEIARFMDAERRKTQRSLQFAKGLKLMATLVALGVLALVIGATIYLVRRNPNLFGR